MRPVDRLLPVHRQRAISLMYHDVVEGHRYGSSGFSGRDADTYKLDTQLFRAHLEALEHAGVRPLSSVRDSTDSGGNRLLLTFDDGGAGAYDPVADLLDARGWKGHFFITTDYIGHPSFVDQGQIRSLHQRGHVIGAHTASHPSRIASLSPERLAGEWERSVWELSSILGEKVTAASIPGGDYSTEVARAAAAAGIRYLFTSEPVVRTFLVEGCLILGRFAIKQATSPETAAAIADGRLLPRAEQYLLWNGKKWLKRAGGSLYLRMRQKIYSGK